MVFGDEQEIQGSGVFFAVGVADCATCVLKTVSRKGVCVFACGVGMVFFRKYMWVQKRF